METPEWTEPFARTIDAAKTVSSSVAEAFATPSDVYVDCTSAASVRENVLAPAPARSRTSCAVWTGSWSRRPNTKTPR